MLSGVEKGCIGNEWVKIENTYDSNYAKMLTDYDERKELKQMMILKCDLGK